MDPSAELTLVDAFVPRLTAGKYVLTATQTLQVAAKAVIDIESASRIEVPSTTAMNPIPAARTTIPARRLQRTAFRRDRRAPKTPKSESLIR